MMMFTRIIARPFTTSLQRTACASSHYSKSLLRSFSSSSTPDFSDTTRQFSSAPAAAAVEDEDAISPNKDGAGVFDKISFIGSGMMAQAVMEPLITNKLQPANQIMVFDVNFSTMQKLEAQHGVQCAESIKELVDDSDLIICAVKPQNLTGSFFQEIQKGIEVSSKEPIFLSVIAGKGMSVFEQGGLTKIVRSMPNTPATIGQGMTVWSATPNLTVEERKKIKQVLSSCGKSVRAILQSIRLCE